jgi:hypothetical protein
MHKTLDPLLSLPIVKASRVEGCRITCTGAAQSCRQNARYKTVSCKCKVVVGRGPQAKNERVSNAYNVSQATQSLRNAVQVAQAARILAVRAI